MYPIKIIENENKYVLYLYVESHFIIFTEQEINCAMEILCSVTCIKVVNMEQIL